MSEQQAMPVIAAEQPDEEQKRLVAIFADMESKQLEFLDAAAKSIIERIATFLAVLFAVTAFGNNFPPAYLKANTLARSLVIVTLVLYLGAMATGMWSILPRRYKLYRHNLTEMRSELDRMISHKSFWLRVAGILFGLGSLALAGLIVAIILAV